MPQHTHSSRRLHSRLVLGLSAVGLCCLAASPALANTTPANQPGPQAMQDAASRMLVWEDVPASMKVAPGWEFTTKADKQLALELCTKNGKAVLAPQAPVMFQTELGETDALADPVAFQENVWQYADAAAAQKAWGVLQKRARTCTGRSTEQAPGERANISIISNGVTDTLVNGQPGVWTHTYFTKPLTANASSEGGYYVMFLNGDVIQSVEYDYPDTVKLRPALRQQVQQIAQTLAARWIQP